jgi:PhzF family phenazine biosynthesis protein
MKIFQVDAFATELFKGNPAAVMPLDDWLSDETLQALAAENNVSETVFFVPDGDGFAIRWFTPTVEVPLCGHATLASAFVLFEKLGWRKPEITFSTRWRGNLTVRRGRDGLIVLDFPATPCKQAVIPDELQGLIGVRPLEVMKVGGSDLVAVLPTVKAVRELDFDIRGVLRLGVNGLIVTAEAGEDDGFDFACRYFLPGDGIPEDPVTGYAHTILVPLWAKRLGRTDLVSRQVSRRGGTLYCRHLGERVEIAGHGVLYMEGTVHL